MKRGDRVMIRVGQQVTMGMVLMASANSRSLMLGFDGMLGKHAGAMPVLRDGNDVYRSLITDEVVIVDVVDLTDG